MPIVHVQVGSIPVSFPVQRGILSLSTSLVSKCEVIDDEQCLRLPEVHPKLFKLLVDYLYRGNYQGSNLTESPDKRGQDELAAVFRTHTEIYCIALKYRLQHLAEIAISEMEDLEKMEFQSFLEVAEDVYPKLQEDDIWFTERFKQEIPRALSKNPKLAEESWILNVYREVGGKLAVGLLHHACSRLHKLQGGTQDIRPSVWKPLWSYYSYSHCVSVRGSCAAPIVFEKIRFVEGLIKLPPGARPDGNCRSCHHIHCLEGLFAYHPP